jgi:uncharacterized protein YndB with AHSA1/START domain
MNESASSATPETEFSISRTFDAPLRLVWDVCTQADQLAKWWGPKGFIMRACELDFRLGGMFHYGMEAPPGSPMAGGVMWGKFVYREIIKPRLIIFVSSFSDEHGGITRHPMMPSFPAEVLNEETFTEEGGKTTIHLRGHPINASEAEMKIFRDMFPSMRQGFGGTFDQLTEYLQTLREL